MHVTKPGSAADLSAYTPRTGEGSAEHHVLVALERTSFARATYEAALLQRLPARVQAVIREQLLILDAVETGVLSFSELCTAPDSEGAPPCSSKP